MWEQSERNNQFLSLLTNFFMMKRKRIDEVQGDSAFNMEHTERL